MADLFTIILPMLACGCFITITTGSELDTTHNIDSNYTTIQNRTKREALSDLQAMTVMTQEAVNLTADGYCESIHATLMYVDSSLPPSEKCAAFGNLFASLADIPVSTSIALQESVDKVQLESIKNGNLQLQFTLRNLVSTSITALLNAGCIAIDQNDACNVVCLSAMAAEQRIMCSLQHAVLPRLNRLIEMINDELVDTEAPISFIPVLVSGLSPVRHIRDYTTAIMHYAKEQLKINKDAIARYP